MKRNISQKIICALDTSNFLVAQKITRKLRNHLGGIKVGKEFFTAHGPDGIKKISKEGLPIFLDLKFHDIPNTVAKAISNIVRLKPSMITIHATGGAEMIKAAVRANKIIAKKNNIKRPYILAVTVLTSLDKSDMVSLGSEKNIQTLTLRLAKLAKRNGADGIICSPKELKILRFKLGKNFKIVVPGIRPNRKKNDDQKRTMTPKQALDLGADYVVIGRPITESDNPLLAVKKIINECM
ncbi:MAG: orotidine-5'-phosphate decarboxylase [Pseudomonadota bacterium]|nr:orotidine-5'-phosphate decarboxylase [Pseudomonadota bacterium]MEE3207228.1 orotidine-5'-phosphate decarboxylase [Pseudomonadota bacterium]